MVKRAVGIDARYVRQHFVPYFRIFPEGYKRFECVDVPGGVKGTHRLLSAQIARAEVNIDVDERNTGMALAKDEYGVEDDSVPGYLILRPAFQSRFQLQTPRLRDIESWVKRKGGRIDEHAKGDHRRATLYGQSVQLNRAKHGDGTDLASVKALASAAGLTVFQLCQEVR